MMMNGYRASLCCVVLVTIVLSNYLGSGSDTLVSCYNCLSGVQPGCEEHVEPGQLDHYLKSNCSYCVKKVDMVRVTRLCFPKSDRPSLCKSQPSIVSGNTTTYCCDKDKCNSAERHDSTWTLIVASIIMLPQDIF